MAHYLTTMLLLALSVFALCQAMPVDHDLDVEDPDNVVPEHIITRRSAHLGGKHLASSDVEDGVVVAGHGVHRRSAHPDHILEHDDEKVKVVRRNAVEEDEEDGGSRKRRSVVTHHESVESDLHAEIDEEPRHRRNAENDDDEGESRKRRSAVVVDESSEELKEHESTHLRKRRSEAPGHTMDHADAAPVKTEKPEKPDLPWGYGQFGHAKPSEWAEGRCQAGHSQSPIDLVQHEAIFLDNDQMLMFHGYDVPVEAMLAYHDYMATLTFPEDFEASVEGGGLTGKFFLDHIEMRWSQGLPTGSEHKIGGKGYPVELQFVHRCAGETMSSALGKPGCVAVLAVFGEIRLPFIPTDLSAAVDTLDNAFFTPDVTVHKQPTPVNVTLKELLPADVQSFYRYDGSMTTPGCTEGVVWTVFEDTLPISFLMLDGLRLMRNVALQHTFITGNARPTQARNDRIVYYRHYVTEDGHDAKWSFLEEAVYVLGL